MYNTENIVGKVSVFGCSEVSFYSMGAGSLSCAASVVYGYPTEKAVLQEIAEKKTAVKSSEKFYDLGSCLTVYYPVLQDQNIVGIIRVIYPETNVTNEIMQELVHIIQNVRGQRI